MKIGIHHREGSFSDRWIDYCENNFIKYTLLDCFDSNIIHYLIDNEITHLMWHINHSSYRDLMVYPYVMNAADQMGIKTFPNFKTRWHFDDKIAQKYLFESIGAPFVKTNVFYNREDAISFLKDSQLPLVGKLKRGAGSTNVRLISSIEEGEKYITKSFSKGFRSVSPVLGNFDQKLRTASRYRNPKILFHKIYRYTIKNNRERKLGALEKGYVYFQDFMPGNDYDTRIIVINNKAFGIRRFNKLNDFRASGSGKIDFDMSKIDLNMVKIAFDITKRINGQCLAFDFVYSPNAEVKIVEVSFGFSMKAYDDCPGYWNSDLSLVHGYFSPQKLMIENFINK